MNMSNATAQVASDLLNAQAILSDTTATRSAVEREYLKPYWKLERSLYFTKLSIKPLILEFSVTDLTIPKYRRH